ncbi:13964_t:CDS:2, partial [Acaulospora colombiana]
TAQTSLKSTLYRDMEPSQLRTEAAVRPLLTNLDDLEHVAEVQVLEIRHIQEPFLDSDFGHRASLGVSDLKPSILPEFLLFFFGRSRCCCSITDLVAPIEVPSESKNDEDLDALRSLEENRYLPMSHMACIVSFLVCPEVVVVIHERERAAAGPFATNQGRLL